MRRLDDGKGAPGGKPGNMFEFLGGTSEERAKNLQTIKAWLGDGAVHRMPFYFDVDPYVWADRIASSGFVRVSESERLNMTSGHGSAAPLFVVDGRR